MDTEMKLVCWRDATSGCNGGLHYSLSTGFLCTRAQKTVPLRNRRANLPRSVHCSTCIITLIQETYSRPSISLWVAIKQ
jgi:hypothetical protein